MQFKTHVLVLMALSACAPDENQFLNEFVPHECTWALSCFSDAALSFSGWDSQDACVDDLGTQIVTQTSECTYDPESASLCLDHLDETTCTEDEAIALPLECYDVYTSCESWL